jgi:hypothetical protein
MAATADPRVGVEAIDPALGGARTYGRGAGYKPESVRIAGD